jgi:RNA polymerase sigma-70 factor (ECF subfamily)
LCEDYWRPLYYFARRKGHSPADAQDLTQGFIAGLLEDGGMARADRERGKFRTFLIASFCHYLAKQQREQIAQKRGGGVVPISLDESAEAGFFSEAAEAMTPELLYDHGWALALLGRVMAHLRKEYEEAGRGELFRIIQPHLSGGAGRPGYARLGEKLDMSESAITVAVHRMRRRYGVLLREEIAATVATPEAVDEELRYLIQIVSVSPSVFP